MPHTHTHTLSSNACWLQWRDAVYVWFEGLLLWTRVQIDRTTTATLQAHFPDSSKPGALRSPHHCALVRAAAELVSLALSYLSGFLPDFCGPSLAETRSPQRPTKVVRVAEHCECRCALHRTAPDLLIPCCLHCGDPVAVCRGPCRHASRPTVECQKSQVCLQLRVSELGRWNRGAMFDHHLDAPGCHGKRFVGSIWSSEDPRWQSSPQHEQI